jgi:IclR family pca regulon transcriptional regulator
MASPESEEFVRGFARGLAVIEAMGDGAPSKTIADIAQVAHLPRSVVKRLVLTLCELRFADTDGKLFRLTPRVLKLGLSWLQSLPFWRYAQPVLEELRTRTEESCSMAVLDGEDIVYVLRVPSKHILATSLSVGSRLPAYAVSLGHVLLAHLDEIELPRYFESVDLKARTPRTLTSESKLRQVLKTVRQKGYAWVDGELDVAICGIAVPVRDGEGRAIAAINVSLISGAWNESSARERFLVPLRHAAEQIRPAMLHG